MHVLAWPLPGTRIACMLRNAQHEDNKRFACLQIHTMDAFRSGFSEYCHRQNKKEKNAYMCVMIYVRANVDGVIRKLCWLLAQHSIIHVSGSNVDCTLAAQTARSWVNWKRIEQTEVELSLVERATKQSPEAWIHKSYMRFAWTPSERQRFYAIFRT